MPGGKLIAPGENKTQTFEGGARFTFSGPSEGGGPGWQVWAFRDSGLELGQRRGIGQTGTNEEEILGGSMDPGGPKGTEVDVFPGLGGGGGERRIVFTKTRARQIGACRGGTRGQQHEEGNSGCCWTRIARRTRVLQGGCKRTVNSKAGGTTRGGKEGVRAFPATIFPSKGAGVMFQGWFRHRRGAGFSPAGGRPGFEGAGRLA